MAIKITTSTNINRWLRKFEKKADKLRSDVSEEPRTQAKLGQQLGRNLAPRDTGTLINAISWKVISKDRTGGQALIWVQPLMNRHRKASTYAGIHHSIGGKGPLKQLPGQQKPSTGDFHWLFIVKEELARRYRKAVLGHIQRFR